MGMCSWRSKLGSFPSTVRRESIICLPAVFASAICLLLLNRCGDPKRKRDEQLKKKLWQATLK